MSFYFEVCQSCSDRYEQLTVAFAFFFAQEFVFNSQAAVASVQDESICIKVVITLPYYLIENLLAVLVIVIGLGYFHLCRLIKLVIFVSDGYFRISVLSGGRRYYPVQIFGNPLQNFIWQLLRIYSPVYFIGGAAHPAIYADGRDHYHRADNHRG